MNLNTFYVLFGFLALYGIITTLRDKKKKRDEISKEALTRLQDRQYKKELEKVINFSQDDAINIAELRKKYFLNYKDAKQLLEIIKNKR
ncbi:MULTISPECIES: hypothetical protein [Gemella]|uniref:hypothetical protein n=1 Tax=Gemella TaxID=1378 RepID=UPI000767FD79|nr:MULTISPECIES: hypothetical protein [Gemella]AME08833.1 hypothetical protein AXE85_00805 [Gemella sp. oral taxon 928]AXI26403.1 hypothetical protein CG018_02565 [Gemella sp. ND 6198]